MDISSEIIKSHSNRDFISTIIPGILLLTIIALMLHLSDIVQIKEWVEPKYYIFEFVLSYILGFLSRIFSMQIIGKLIPRFSVKIFNAKFAEFDEDKHLSYYFSYLTNYFLLDKHVTDSKKEGSYIINLAEDLVEQNKLLDIDKIVTRIGLLCSLLTTFVIYLACLIFAKIINYWPVNYLSLFVILIILIIIFIVGLYYEIVDEFVDYTVDVVASAGTYLRSTEYCQTKKG